MIAARYASLVAFAQARAFCPSGEGGGVDNSCSSALSVSHAEVKDAWGKDSYQIKGETLKTHSYSIRDTKTGGTASLKVGAYYDYSGGDFSPQATQVDIVSWHATPLEAIAAHGLAATDDYKGKGFGRSVMKAAIEIADKHNASVLSIFAPSPDSQAVMKHYTETGLLSPIQSSKAVYGDYFTSFFINKDAARDFLHSKKTSQRAFCPTGKGGGIDNSCSVGINVNDSHQDFTGQILSGTKTTETRITHSLKPYVGKTVGIVRTGKGKATLVGTMKIGEPKFYKTKDEFDADFDKHQIAPDSPHYIGSEGKYGYPLSEVKPVKPVTLDSKGIVARVIHKSDREITVEYQLGGESPEHPRERAFCPNGDGGGVTNSCSGTNSQVGGGTLKSAISRWKGSTSDLGIHIQDEINGAPPPSSGSGKKLREMAASLLAAVKENSEPAPTLYRGDDKLSGSNSSPVVGWTSNPRVAEKWASRYGGSVEKLEGAVGLRLAKVVGSVLDMGEDEWLVLNTPHNGKQSRSIDCGRDDDGRFASGNKCGGEVDMPKEDPRGRLRYDNGVQTDAARKLYQIGSSEEKLRGLVEAVGGDPKTTTVDINPPSLNISVSDKDGNKLFHVDLENGRARLYPTKDLSASELAKAKDAAVAAFGSTQADTKVIVYRKADDIKKWESENAKKIQKWEDKYAFSTLLPPHQRPKKWERSLDARHASLLAFAQARAFCPTGDGGGVDNSCGAKAMSAPAMHGGGGSATTSSVVFSSATTANLRDGDTVDASDEDAMENVDSINWQAAEDIGQENRQIEEAVYRYSVSPAEVNGHYRYEESSKEYAGNLGSTPEKIAEAAMAVESAISLIAKTANPEGKELTSFRGLMGLKKNKEYIDEIKSVSPGDIIKEAGVFSTSASLRRAAMAFTSQDGGVIFRVRGRSGAPIARIAKHIDEWELAYPHRSRFVVTSVSRGVSVRISDSHRLTNVTFIDIKEVD